MVVDARLPIWQQIAAEDQNEDPDENIQHFKKRPQFTLGISFAFWKFTLHDAFPVAFHQSVMVMLLAAGRFSICLPVEVWREFIIPHLCFHAWSV